MGSTVLVVIMGMERSWKGMEVPGEGVCMGFSRVGYLE